MVILAWLLATASILLFIQACYSIYISLWAWNDSRRLRPEVSFSPPSLSFSVLIPARHEERVIGETVLGVVNANYPKELLEVFVICSSDDLETIGAALRTVERYRLENVRVLTFDSGPISKPHALNVGLREATRDYVVIFDAEDDVQPEIFNAVNAQVQKDGSDVVQGPVQLMNYDSSWYSTFNVLEYFVWYNSRLRLQARNGAVPLGGNTVFFRRQALLDIGGWDEHCLTEDADVGIRLSARGASVHVLFNPLLATREETPHTVGAFVRQRSRWHQGFIQVLLKGDWLGLPTSSALWLGGYTLFFPVFHSITTLFWPAAIFFIFFLDIPVLPALLTYLPAYTLAVLYAINVALLWEFTRLYQLPFRPLAPLVMAVMFLPFQWLLGISSIRALIRELLGQKGWEKTFHRGAHRVAREAPAMEAEGASSRI